MVWVFRWTFSSLPPLSHLQSFVSLRYRTFMLGTEMPWGGAWVFGSVCHLVLLHLLLLHTSYISGNSRQSQFLSRELSTDSRQSSDSYFSSVKSSPEPDIKLAQIWLTNKSQPFMKTAIAPSIILMELWP